MASLSCSKLQNPSSGNEEIQKIINVKNKTGQLGSGVRAPFSGVLSESLGQATSYCDEKRLELYGNLYIFLTEMYLIRSYNCG